jgi:hypothetical protein
LSSYWVPPSTSDLETTEIRGSLSFGRPRVPCGLLDALAARLREEVRGQQTGLTIGLQGMSLAIVYHHVVVMRWMVVGGELVCSPIGWHRRTYAAAGPEEARTIAIRLVLAVSPGLIVRICCGCAGLGRANQREDFTHDFGRAEREGFPRPGRW